MQKVLDDAGQMESEVYKARRCIFELRGKAINPYHLMESMDYQKCSAAVRRLTPKIGGCVDKIQEIIEELPVLSEIQKQFYTSIIEYRYKNVLLPICQKVMEKEFGCPEQVKGRCR